MTHGSLFSGIGGFDLAAHWMGWDNIFHCEWNEFGQKVLKHHFQHQKVIMTLPKQTSLFTEEKSTFLQEDSLANLTHQQENVLGKPMKDISFLKCLEQSRRLNPRGLLVRTFVDLLVGKGDWYSTRCALIWRGKAMKSNRFLFQLLPKMLPTKENEYGLLPTPNCTRIDIPTMEEVNKRKEIYGGERRAMYLTHFIAMGFLPTPMASDHHGGTAKISEKFDRRSNLKHNIAQKVGKASQLHPAFVEEMMGFPTNWTLLPFLSGVENQSKPMETL